MKAWSIVVRIAEDILSVKYTAKRHAMAKAVSRWPLTGEDQI
jgi:hypothetical protein